MRNIYSTIVFIILSSFCSKDNLLINQPIYLSAKEDPTTKQVMDNLAWHGDDIYAMLTLIYGLAGTGGDEDYGEWYRAAYRDNRAGFIALVNSL